jgi:hypothetical protein
MTHESQGTVAFVPPPRSSHTGRATSFKPGHDRWTTTS